MNERFKYTLGLDLGVQSIGWAVVPRRVSELEKMKLGVRCFESGTGPESDIDNGSDKAKNSDRRSARSARRLLRRRSQRMMKLMRLLQEMGLLPKCNFHSPEERDRMLAELDKSLFVFCAPDERREAHLLPYILRKYGLDERLPEHGVGRAIYHLAQRRGFLSNRKAVVKEENKPGTVKKEIGKLEQEIKESGSRTLGEYLAGRDAEEKRIRKQYTLRKMYEDEFELLWESQARFHAIMTPEWKEKVHQAIFFQRPLKSQRDKLGFCDLEKGHRRAPMGCLEAQRFRYWQKIIDLKYRIGEEGEWTSLTEDEQNRLAEILENKESISFKDVKESLGFKKTVPLKFNLEHGGEKKLRGNSTSARLGKALPGRWENASDAEKKIIVDEILQFQQEEALQRRLEKAFLFTSTEAMAAAVVPLENGYARLSRKALSALLERMKETRQAFKTVEKELYHPEMVYEEPMDRIPPLKFFLKKIQRTSLSNPVVERTLTELRKVVNAIVRKYGKPECIVVELARSLKRGRKQREESSARMRQNEERREKAYEKILADGRNQNPSRTDILKVQLAEECKWMCPYTGNQISMDNLLGPYPQFDIEHILPLSRSMDDSMLNKTLCDSVENRHTKRGKSPYEAYFGTPQYEEILKRVQILPEPKRKRFRQEFITKDFSQRMLNDTRYISRLAVAFLGTLFGGDVEVSPNDKEGKRKIFACTGDLTSLIRGAWGMNRILNSGRNVKTRTDHRHHAIDAVAIAYCSVDLVQKFSIAAQNSEDRKVLRNFAGEIAEPPCSYRRFQEILQKAVSAINVSYRSSKKVSGALHKETLYSKEHWYTDEKGQRHSVRHKRIPLEALKLKDIEKIVDKAIQRIVQEKVNELGNIKLFKDSANHPYREVNEKGTKRRIPIHQVRIRVNEDVLSIGKGATQRYVKTGGNHHLEVVAILDENGNETKWEGIVVTMFEAYQRRRNKQPIVCREHGEGKRFKFSLFRNEYLQKTNEDGSKTLYRIFKMSKNGTIGWGEHTDAREAKIVTDKTPGNSPSINPLRGIVEKVSVDLLGEIHPANG